MAARKELIPSCEIVTSLSLNELCRICGSPAEWIVELVEEGILDPEGAARREWRFASTSITVIRRVQRLQGDLSLNIPGVAVVMTLADENARLKRRLAQLEAGHWDVDVIPMPGD